jgi:hypothetical protein
MAQKIPSRAALQNLALIGETSAFIDWRFGIFIHFDTDTYYGPGQIGILSQNDARGYILEIIPTYGHEEAKVPDTSGDSEDHGRAP